MFSTRSRNTTHHNLLLNSSTLRRNEKRFDEADARTMQRVKLIGDGSSRFGGRFRFSSCSHSDNQAGSSGNMSSPILARLPKRSLVRTGESNAGPPASSLKQRASICCMCASKIDAKSSALRTEVPAISSYRSYSAKYVKPSILNVTKALETEHNRELKNSAPLGANFSSLVATVIPNLYARNEHHNVHDTPNKQDGDLQRNATDEKSMSIQEITKRNWDKCVLRSAKVLVNLGDQKRTPNHWIDMSKNPERLQRDLHQKSSFRFTSRDNNDIKSDTKIQSQPVSRIASSWRRRMSASGVKLDDPPKSSSPNRSIMNTSASADPGKQDFFSKRIETNFKRCKGKVDGVLTDSKPTARPSTFRFRARNSPSQPTCKNEQESSSLIGLSHLKRSSLNLMESSKNDNQPLPVLESSPQKWRMTTLPENDKQKETVKSFVPKCPVRKNSTSGTQSPIREKPPLPRKSPRPSLCEILQRRLNEKYHLDEVQDTTLPDFNQSSSSANALDSCSNVAPVKVAEKRPPSSCNASFGCKLRTATQNIKGDDSSSHQMKTRVLSRVDRPQVSANVNRCYSNSNSPKHTSNSMPVNPTLQKKKSEEKMKCSDSGTFSYNKSIAAEKTESENRCSLTGYGCPLAKTNFQNYKSLKLTADSGQRSSVGKSENLKVNLSSNNEKSAMCNWKKTKKEIQKNQPLTTESKPFICENSLPEQQIPSGEQTETDCSHSCPLPFPIVMKASIPRKVFLKLLQMEKNPDKLSHNDSHCASAPREIKECSENIRIRPRSSSFQGHQDQIRLQDPSPSSRAKQRMNNRNRVRHRKESTHNFGFHRPLSSISTEKDVPASVPIAHDSFLKHRRSSAVNSHHRFSNQGINSPKPVHCPRPSLADEYLESDTQPHPNKNEIDSPDKHMIQIPRLPLRPLTTNEQQSSLTASKAPRPSPRRHPPKSEARLHSWHGRSKTSNDIRPESRTKNFQSKRRIRSCETHTDVRKSNFPITDPRKRRTIAQVGSSSILKKKISDKGVHHPFGCDLNNGKVSRQLLPFEEGDTPVDAFDSAVSTPVVFEDTENFPFDSPLESSKIGYVTPGNFSGDDATFDEKVSVYDDEAFNEKFRKPKLEITAKSSTRRRNLAPRYHTVTKIIRRKPKKRKENRARSFVQVSRTNSSFNRGRVDNDDVHRKKMQKNDVFAENFFSGRKSSNDGRHPYFCISNPDSNG